MTGCSIPEPRHFILRRRGEGREYVRDGPLPDGHVWTWQGDATRFTRSEIEGLRPRLTELNARVVRLVPKRERHVTTSFLLDATVTGVSATSIELTSSDDEIVIPLRKGDMSLEIARAFGAKLYVNSAVEITVAIKEPVGG
jgi:hypothetical protein